MCGIQVHSIEDVKRMIALILIEKCGTGSSPSEAMAEGGRVPARMEGSRRCNRSYLHG